MAFKEALRTQSTACIALYGPSKSGKSLTALRTARALVGPDGKIAARDSEHGSLSKYAVIEGEPESEFAFFFDVDEPKRHSPQDYCQAIADAEAGGYDVLILDSISHEWIGTGGALQIVDEATKQAGSKSAFTSGWKTATPLHNQFLDRMNASSVHIIATIRTKMDYVLETDPKTKKMKPKRVGMAPVQRENIEYEFDVFCNIDADHTLTVSGSRCPDLEKATFKMPRGEVGEIISKWLGAGAPAAKKLKAEAKAEPKPRPAIESSGKDATAAEKQELVELSVEIAGKMNLEAYEDADEAAKALRRAAADLFDLRPGAQVKKNALEGLKAAMQRAQQDSEGQFWIEADVSVEGEQAF